MIIEERLTEVRTWLKELPKKSEEAVELDKEEQELVAHLSHENLKEELANLSVSLGVAETSKDTHRVEELTKRIKRLHEKMRALEENSKAL